MKKKKIDNSALEKLTFEQVSTLDHGTMGGKGRDYYESAMVSRATFFHNHVSGRVGNYVEFHDVHVTFHENEIASSCSCRQSRKICKHIIALLYAWADDRNDFLSVEQVLLRVKKMNKERLLEIVEHIICHNPEFADIFLANKVSDWDEIEDIN